MFAKLTETEIRYLHDVGEIQIGAHSPLHSLLARELTMDPARARDSLRAKEAIPDDGPVQLTDEILDRIAPVAECDGHICVERSNAAGQSKQDFYLLDEVCVQHIAADHQHAFGKDLDSNHFRHILARPFYTRTAAGRRLNGRLGPREYRFIQKILRTGVRTGDPKTFVVRAELFHKTAEEFDVERDPGAIIRTTGLFRQRGKNIVLRGPGWSFLQAIIAKNRVTISRQDFGRFDDNREIMFMFGPGTFFSLERTSANDVIICEPTRFDLIRRLKNVIGPLSERIPEDTATVTPVTEDAVTIDLPQG